MSISSTLRGVVPLVSIRNKLFTFLSKTTKLSQNNNSSRAKGSGKEHEENEDIATHSSGDVPRTQMISASPPHSLTISRLPK